MTNTANTRNRYPDGSVGSEAIAYSFFGGLSWDALYVGYFIHRIWQCDSSPNPGRETFREAFYPRYRLSKAPLRAVLCREWPILRDVTNSVPNGTIGVKVARSAPGIALFPALCYTFSSRLEGVSPQSPLG